MSDPVTSTMLYNTLNQLHETDKSLWDIMKTMSSHCDDNYDILLKEFADNAVVTGRVSGDAKALSVKYTSGIPFDASSSGCSLDFNLSTDETTITQSGSTLTIVSSGIWEQISSTVKNNIPEAPNVPVYGVSSVQTPAATNSKEYVITKTVDETTSALTPTIEIPKDAEYAITTTTASDGYAKTYVLTKDGEPVTGSKIDIPRDQFLLTSNFVWANSGTVTGFVTGNPTGQYTVPYLYLEMAVSGKADNGETASPANASSFIDLSKLLDNYTGVSGVHVSDYKVRIDLKEGEQYLSVSGGKLEFNSSLLNTTISQNSTLTSEISFMSGVLSGYNTAKAVSSAVSSLNSDVSFVSSVLSGYQTAKAVSSAISSIVGDVSTINTKLGEVGTAKGEVLIGDSSTGNIKGSDYKIGVSAYNSTTSAAFASADFLATEKAVTGYVATVSGVIANASSNSLLKLNGVTMPSANTIALWDDVNGQALTSSAYTISNDAVPSAFNSATKVPTEFEVKTYVENGLETLYSSITGLLETVNTYRIAPEEP